VEVPVTFEAFAGHRTHGIDRPELRNLWCSEMNGLDRHLSIMPEAPASSGRSRVAEAALQAHELDLVVARLLHSLGDAAGGTDRRTVVLILRGPPAFGHAPSVD
jgi:hypothetical protein